MKKSNEAAPPETNAENPKPKNTKPAWDELVWDQDVWVDDENDKCGEA